MLRSLSANAQGAVIALAAFAVFSVHDVLVKLLGGTYAPVQVLFFTVLFSFPLFTLVLIQKQRSGSLRPHRPLWTGLRTVSVAITGLSAFTAFSLLPLTQVYAILFSMPLLITLMSIPVLGERVGIHRGAAVLVGLCGVLIVLRPGTEPLSLGHLAALLAAVCGSFASVIVRKIGQEERSAVLLLYPLLTNLVVMGLALPFYYTPMPVADLGVLAAIAALSLTGTGLMILAYRTGEAAVVAPMQYSQIVLATLFGWALFNETPDLGTIIGASIVIASGAYVVWRESGVRDDGNQPVLRTRSRVETGAAPRVSALMNERRNPED
ncbi:MULTISPECIES: DMT family transporter [unclassified Meridianimarinicoccus]|uniref:DMT family transporter n=1 Tax=unclassified Meridianimarinicoccus TaxID=2923344 RepID=UPI001D010C1B|nr:DMT family transporter [Fluviibacterium sp. MJW13]